MKFPIGIQTFEKLITGGYVYVDKTDLVYKLVSSGEYYFLSRPRRFGKSLLTTTLESYFLGKKDLFKGLAIDSLETEWIEYPVFHLDFSGGDYTKESALQNRLGSVLSEWELKYGRVESEKEIGDRFYGVISRAKERTGRKVVILVDEYDKPLTDAIGLTEIQDNNRAVLQSLYGIFKRGDSLIKFTFLTGVTRYGKLGIFSAANNLNDISKDDKYSSICGISERELRKYFDGEVESFANKKGVSKDEIYERLKKKYDGYHFSEDAEDIYNPFSLLNSLSKQKLDNYWFATGTPTYLAKILKKQSYDLTTFNKEIVSTAEGMASFGNGEDNIIAALYQSGYLTIKSYEDEIYKLGFPNEEVADGFVRYLAIEFAGKSMNEWDTDIYTLKQHIRNDDVDSFMTQMQQIISEVPFESDKVKLIEANFRNLLYLMIRATGYNVTVERPVLSGRIDLFFETNNYIYIIECKRDESAEIALAQIDEKRYAEKVSSHDKKIVKIGANFSTKERNLTEWKVGNRI
ncbi:MAG: ATP-binding protein [Paludibacteraceae bacterium]|nr:ATP-binding protein [Paludibacteraceae bacterium]